MCPYAANFWNWFDLVVVSTSLLSLWLDEIPGVSILRLFRAFRVFRLVKRVESLQKIILGVLKSLPGVLNAFLLLLTVTGIWAIIGVELFRERYSEFYGDFFLGCVTQLQILTLDSWGSQIMRPIVLNEGGGTAIFFFAYVFVNSIVMTNVVVAILIDRFLAASNEIEEEKQSRELAQSRTSRGLDAALSVEPDNVSIASAPRARLMAQSSQGSSVLDAANGIAAAPSPMSGSLSPAERSPDHAGPEGGADSPGWPVPVLLERPTEEEFGSGVEES
mmetsp:Transcript_30220/g.72488  ORF Transcript_30220/g.72488 Transcript_30220/m.72488 type:complete len:276 (+) Transcript_30220:1-828(+)